MKSFAVALSVQGASRSFNPALGTSGLPEKAIIHFARQNHQCFTELLT